MADRVTSLLTGEAKIARTASSDSTDSVDVEDFFSSFRESALPNVFYSKTHISVDNPKQECGTAHVVIAFKGQCLSQILFTEAEESW
jgi:hypothetical protein